MLFIHSGKFQKKISSSLISCIVYIFMYENLQIVKQWQKISKDILGVVQAFFFLMSRLFLSFPHVD